MHIHTYTHPSPKAVAPQPDPEETRPTREAALEVVLAAVQPGDAVVGTTGYTSRELYELRAKAGGSHAADFLCVGSMGHATAIAQGIALAQPERTVWCLDGDGAALMHLGNLAGSGGLGLTNLRHVLLNNRVHDSVGGQPTVASQAEQLGGAAKPLDYTAAALASGYAVAKSVATPAQLQQALGELPASPGGPVFVEVALALGTRTDLGRPKTSTADAKKAFMGYLRN